MTQPSNLLGVILDGALSDGEVYINTQWRDRISTLPTYTQNKLRELIAKKDFKSPLFEEFNDVIGKHFSSRLIPTPQCLLDSKDGLNETIYSAMQGDCEFMFAGKASIYWSQIIRTYSVSTPNKEYCICPHNNPDLNHTGHLEGWTITERLPVVNVPTLVLAGQYDTMTEECSQVTSLLNGYHESSRM